MVRSNPFIILFGLTFSFISYTNLTPIPSMIHIKTFTDIVVESMARLVGALPSEVVVMNSLTVNLHLMMVSFYRPTPIRHKILIEKKAFPSDIHAVTSQILHHQLDALTSLLEIGSYLHSYLSSTLI